MKTEFIAITKTKDGFNDKLTDCALVFFNGKIMAVYPSGWHTAIPQKAIDSKEAEWLMVNHPEARNYKINRHFSR